LRSAFGGPLTRTPSPPERVVAELVSAADGGLTGTAGPRYFGFVIGGALPAATAAEILTAGWDQCAYNEVLSPAAAAAEDAAGSWLKEILGLPASASVCFVTGAQAANTVGLAAGRHHMLAEAGWDVERDGLLGAPRVRVIASVERHATIDRALLPARPRHRDRRARRSGRERRDRSGLVSLPFSRPARPGRRSVCLQAGNVNTGAVDDFSTAIPIARRYGAWVHVDGAFGAVGGRESRDGTPTCRRGGGRLLGMRRAQVAQRPLRLWSCLLRISAHARGGNLLCCGVPRRVGPHRRFHPR